MGAKNNLAPIFHFSLVVFHCQYPASKLYNFLCDEHFGSRGKAQYVLSNTQELILLASHLNEYSYFCPYYARQQILSKNTFVEVTTHLPTEFYINPQSNCWDIGRIGSSSA